MGTNIDLVDVENQTALGLAAQMERYGVVRVSWVQE